MRSIIIAALLAAGVVVAGAAAAHAQAASAAAQDDPAYSSCTQRNGTTVGLVNCAMDESGRWDKRLNTAYQRIMASPNWSAATKALVRDAQRAWLAYKKAKCAAEGELQYEGGTASQITSAICEMNETALRATELEGALITH